MSSYKCQFSHFFDMGELRKDDRGCCPKKKAEIESLEGGCHKEPEHGEEKPTRIFIMLPWTGLTLFFIKNDNETSLHWRNAFHRFFPTEF